MREAPDGTRRVGRIVEVEAYGGSSDRASHARAGRTARTAVMFGPPGRAYVYLVYGMYDCLNVVTGPVGVASAVLIRAVEPLEGVEVMAAARADMAALRGRPTRYVPAPGRLASGPGLVCAAFGIDRSFTGADLCDPRGALRLEPARAEDRSPVTAWTARVGVDYAGEPWASLAWRLADRGSAAVSSAIPPDARAEPDVEPGHAG